MLNKRLISNPLIENFLSLTILQGINYLLPLITIPYLYNHLGVERYGLVNFAISFIQYFLIVTDFGFGLSGTRYIAENRDHKEAIDTYVNSATFSRIGICIISFAVLLICLFLIPSLRQEKVFFLLFFGQVIGNIMSPYWFFQGMEQMRFITIMTVITKILSLTPLFFVVKDSVDYFYIPLCYSIGSIGSGIICLYLMRKRFGVNFFFPKIQDIVIVTKDSANYFLSRISVSMFTNTNTFILGLVLGNTIVGYYSLADKVYQALTGIYQPLVAAIFPYMTKNKRITLFKKIFIWSNLANICLIVIVALGISDIMHLLFRNVDESSVKVMHIFLFACLVALPNTLLGYPFLAALGHPNFTNYSLVGVSLMHIVIIVCLWACGWISIYNVAWIVVITETSLLFIRAWGGYKYKLYGQSIIKKQ